MYELKFMTWNKNKRSESMIIEHKRKPVSEFCVILSKMKYIGG